MTQCVTLCMTQNMGATLLKIGVYDTKMYDTKCKTVLLLLFVKLGLVSGRRNVVVAVKKEINLF